MVNNLYPVLDTRGMHVFRPPENTNQYKEFRLKVLPFLSPSAPETIPGHEKTTLRFLHSKPFLRDQANEVRHVANTKRKLSRATAPDDASFLCSGVLSVIWRNAHKTKISDPVDDKEAGLLITHHKAAKDKPLCETHDFSGT